jgi:hypothetical protein
MAVARNDAPVDPQGLALRDPDRAGPNRAWCRHLARSSWRRTCSHLTTNNITYAAFGDALGYWQFFPTGEAGWGHMPVWGFADVAASQAPGIEPGERFFGFFPASPAT